GMPGEQAVLVAGGDGGVERQLDAARRADRPAPTVVMVVAARAQPPDARDVLHARRQPLEVAPKRVDGVDRRLYPQAFLYVHDIAFLADAEQTPQLEVRQRAAEQHESGTAEQCSARS